MHLHGEECPATDDSGKRKNMANSGVDIRLRRQAPVSMKPPRLRLSTNNNGSLKARLSSLHPPQSAVPQRKQSSLGNNENNNSPVDVPSGSLSSTSSGGHRSYSSVSKASGTSSCSRRIKGRSRASITATTFTATTTPASKGAPSLGFVASASLSTSSTRGLSRSCENVGTAVFSTVNGDGSNGNSGKPLIHHQRHNLKNRFQLLKTLGEGTYGKVKLAADKSSGEHVAIKYIKKTKMVDDADLARIRREIQILSSLRHSHVVNIREVFEKRDKIVLVMDYAQGGELYDYLNSLGHLSEWEARRIFRQIVSAIHCCHQNGIVHRDLKLENIILDDVGNVKIADFGMANYYSTTDKLTTFCGSPLYASPEIVNGRSYYGPEVDVWSLGVILYTLVYGSMPFESNSLVSLKQQISEGYYRQPPKPSDAAGLIRHMLTVTPSRRATVDDALKHWWVNFGHAHMPNGQPYNPCADDEAPLTSTVSPLPHPHDVSEVALSQASVALSSDTQSGHVPLNINHDSVQNLPRRRHSLDAEYPFKLPAEVILPLPPPAIIHQRNQSSLSSDSDAELELLKSSQWTQPQPDLNGGKHPEQQQHRKRGWRFGQQKLATCALDSTGNSVNSSGSASPALNTEDQGHSKELGESLCHGEERTYVNETRASQRDQKERAVSSNLLKLPPALMDILGGCSEHSLAALLSPDPETNIVSFNPFGLLDNFNKNGKDLSQGSDTTSHPASFAPISNNSSISPSLDFCSISHASDITNFNGHNSDNSHSSHPPYTTTTATTSIIPSPSADVFVFDSERKPKRSILKRRGKFSGGETTERGNDFHTDSEEHTRIPKSGGGHLPRRLPSFRDEAHGIFASKHHASQLLEEAASGIVHEGCSSALLHSHHKPWGRHSVTPAVITSSCSSQSPSLPVSEAELAPSPDNSQRQSIHTSNIGNQQSSSKFISDHSLSSQSHTFPLQDVNSIPGSEHEFNLCDLQDQPPTSSTVRSKDFATSAHKSHLEGQAETPVSCNSHSLSIAESMSQKQNVDVTNGNYSSTAMDTYLVSSQTNESLPFTAISKSNFAVPRTDCNVQHAKGDGLSVASTPVLSKTRTWSSISSSEETCANSCNGCATNSFMITPHGECSANSSPTRFKTTSANGSSRSSASNSSGDSAYESSSLSSYSSTPSLSSLSAALTSTTTKVVRRPASILRTSQLEQARNRLSVSSIGSNSSADILDLSYDSGDSDHFVNLEVESSRQTPCSEDGLAIHQRLEVTSELSVSDVTLVPKPLPDIGGTVPYIDLESKLSMPTQSARNENTSFPCVIGVSRGLRQNHNNSSEGDVDLMIFPNENEPVSSTQSMIDSQRFISSDDCALTTPQTFPDGSRHSSLCSHQVQATESLFPGGLDTDQAVTEVSSLSMPMADLESSKNPFLLRGMCTQMSNETSLPMSTPNVLSFPSDANSDGQCLQTMMAELDLDQLLSHGSSQRQVTASHQDGMRIEAAEHPVVITESGSPLLYRLTREAQTWL